VQEDVDIAAAASWLAAKRFIVVRAVCEAFEAASWTPGWAT
jgi:hypothetical protein